jgi:signal transduction histidine kinase
VSGGGATTGRLWRWTAAAGLVASFLPAAMAALPAGTEADLIAAGAGAAAVFLLQLAVVRGALRLDSPVTLAWSIAGLLGGPPLLAACHHGLGAGLGDTWWRHLVAHLAVQAIFALAVHRAARGRSRSRSVPGGDPSPAGGTHREAAGRLRPQGLLLALLLPAAGLAAGLGWAGARAVRDAALHSAVAGYSRVAGGVLGTAPPPDAGGVRGLVEALPAFDEAAPFAVGRDGVIAGHLDRERRDRVAAVVAGGPAGAALDPATGRGIVWTTAGPAGIRAGLHLSLPPDPGLPGIVAALILAAALLGALAAAALRSWIGARLSVRVAALEALPDRAVPPLPSGRIRELAALDRAISDLAARLATAPAAGRGAGPEARDARERKARVFAGMSHDLRSPLNSVVGFTDLLLKGMGGELSPEQRAQVAIIAEEAERLLVQIGDILDTARLDAGRFEIEPAWVPSVEILTECATGAERLVASQAVTFASRLQPGLPPVRVDKSRIVQALLSLVARALEATDHGEILLEARRLPGNAGGLSVEIADPGGAVGFRRRAEIAEAWKLSEAGLSHLDAVRPARPELWPAALGLSLARRMVALHGGTIVLGAGQGDRVLFSLTLPLDAGADGR